MNDDSNPIEQGAHMEFEGKHYRAWPSSGYCDNCALLRACNNHRHIHYERIVNCDGVVWLTVPKFVAWKLTK